MSDYFDHLLAYLPLGCGNCVSVYASVTRQSSIKTVGRIELDFSIEVLMFDLSYAALENSLGTGIYKVMGISLPNSVRNAGLIKLRYVTSIVAKVVNLARQKWTLSVIKQTATVVRSSVELS